MLANLPPHHRIAAKKAAKEAGCDPEEAKGSVKSAVGHHFDNLPRNSSPGRQQLMLEYFLARELSDSALDALKEGCIHRSIGLP